MKKQRKFIDDNATVSTKKSKTVIGKYNIVLCSNETIKGEKKRDKGKPQTSLYILLQVVNWVLIFVDRIYVNEEGNTRSTNIFRAEVIRGKFDSRSLEENGTCDTMLLCETRKGTMTKTMTMIIMKRLYVTKKNLNSKNKDAEYVIPSTMKVQLWKSKLCRP